MAYGIWRTRPLDVYYLRKRLSRKPQTITAPPSTPFYKTYLQRTDIKSALTR